MTHYFKPGLANRQELLRWANSIGSRSELPRLIRKLIQETGRGVVELGFPAGEGVGTGGWDGTARATESSAHVPKGLSVWELSVETSVGTKADGDYQKRGSTPDGTRTSDCTYVAVALRPWTKRGDWAKARTAEGRWRRVLAYGVDDIETWLEGAPVTHAWISERLGLGPHGLRAGDTWWRDWARLTDPEISAELLLAGRESAVESLRSRTAGPPSLTTLKAGSLEEVQAFVAAVAVAAAEAGDGRMLARLAFVDDLQTWRALRRQEQPLLIVPVSPEVITEAMTGSDHHVVVPVAVAPSADVELPPIDVAGAKHALQNAGMADEARADREARLARRSLLGFRRRLATKPELLTPEWAKPPGSRLIRGVLLAGRWVDRIDGDRDVLESLVGKQGDDLRQALDELATAGDPLVASVDATWALVSPYDAWQQIRSQIGEPDLERFAEAVRRVLLEVDPGLEMPSEERWQAAVEGKVREHSETLRVGLASSLALLGVNGAEIDGGKGSAFASYLVRVLLDEANADNTGRIWSSLSRLLPLFAEASPDQFLNAVRTGLQGADPVLAMLFTDTREQSSPFTAGSPHTGLLWALENAAWSREHFGQAVDLLAQLEEVDPGGSLGNRPSKSLAAIFCPWHPENDATNAERLAAIDGLRNRHPAVAWPLMLSMLPEDHGVHLPTHEPEFREWKPPRLPVKTAEYFDLVGAITSRRLVEDAGESADRWATLITSGSNVPPVWGDVRDGLRRVAPMLGTEQGALLWKHLRAFIARHRKHSGAGWALPAAELDVLGQIQNDLTPHDASATNAWLFEEHMPDLGTEGEEDYERYMQQLSDRRKEAAAAIVAREGVPALIQVAVRSPVPGVVGWALADPSEDRHDLEVLRLVDSNDDAESAFASGFFGRRFQEAGWQWLDQMLSDAQSFRPRTRARLLLATGDYPRAWETAAAHGAEVDGAFWREFSPYGLGVDFPYMKEVAEKLIAADRPAAALQLLGLYRREDGDGPHELAVATADALEALLGISPEDPELHRLSQYDFQRIFAHLERHRNTLGVDRIARLEWAYLPALGYEPDVATLHEELAANPSFFVQLISAVYRPHTRDDASDPRPDQARAAENGYRLLSSWTRVPGGDAGAIDAEVLDAWVSEAIALLIEADRLDVGLIHVGHVLSHAPTDEDGAWPCEAVRELLERIQSAQVEVGLRTQTFNNRGTTSRFPDAGGDQERALAKRYRDWASKFAGQWPRAASVLRDLATTYENDARREDSEAERHRRGLDR